MARESFGAKLTRLQEQKRTHWGLLIRPIVTRMPLPIQRYDDPFFPFSKSIIAETRDLVCAFVFDMGAYLSLGGAGAVALERSIAFAAEDAVTILHGPFNISSFVDAAGDLGFNADAATISDPDLEAQYRLRVNRAVFAAASADDAPLTHPETGTFQYGSPWKCTFRTASGESRQLEIVGDEIVYASSGADFAQRARDALMTFVLQEKP